MLVSDDRMRKTLHVPTYSDLKGQLLVTIHGLEGVENSWKLLAIELDCGSVLAPIVYDCSTQALMALRSSRLLEFAPTEF